MGKRFQIGKIKLFIGGGFLDIPLAIAVNIAPKVIWTGLKVALPESFLLIRLKFFFVQSQFRGVSKNIWKAAFRAKSAGIVSFAKPIRNISGLERGTAGQTNAIRAL